MNGVITISPALSNQILSKNMWQKLGIFMANQKLDIN
jgi:hypothetical protein